MATTVRPGEIVIKTLAMTGSRGTFDMATALMRASVYESIFKPGIYAEFKVLDVDDALGDLKLSGTETVIFQFTTPDETELATYTFAVNSISLATLPQKSGLQRARAYTIECVSHEVLESRTGPIQKKWNSPITSAVSDIFRSYLGSPKPLATSATAGVQELRISNEKPFTAIEGLRRRANGLTGNAWLFFENRDGYVFKPIEELAAGSSVKSLIQQATIGHDSLAANLNQQILDYTIVSKMAIERALKMGALKTSVSTVNQRTREHILEEIRPVLAGKFGDLSGVFSKVGRAINLAKTSRIPDTQLDKSTPEQAAAAAGQMQLIVHVTGFGDTVYRAGKCVDLTVPKPVAFSGEVEPDSLVKGQFLITKLRHEIFEQGRQPRYLSVLECCQGVSN